ncbi:DUF6708 domain-containing protein [Providencia rettgeri]|uniref:DUF6708 domain-containing protein n=1 Tax=Providencia rettgeri TaxID=587 RepID=UPI002360C486|nr:DUF6708 domain-containing protein [Providencia rettgeri]
MDYYGLFPQFKMNRSLNESEITGKLEQTVRLDFETEHLMPDLKVIEMNSSYLEMTDKFYASKGLLSFIGLFGAIACLGAFFLIVIDKIMKSYYLQWSGMLFIVFIAVTFIPMGLWMLFLLKKEWFAWTHYPIRFDRKNQLVHATRINGSVFTVPWQTVFFTTGLNHRKDIGKDYYISGHVLADDGITVLDTFCLPATNGNVAELKTHWEFVRRYMEEGPEGMKSRIPFCLPIANKKESCGFTFFYSMTKYNGLPLLFLPIIVPFELFYSFSRYMAMLTSQRPVWSAEIQALCRVDDNDPYRLDASMNPKDLWVTLLPKKK